MIALVVDIYPVTFVVNYFAESFLLSPCAKQGGTMAKITGNNWSQNTAKPSGGTPTLKRDCIGLIWKILESRYGAKTNFVGSNWFARHELRNMRPLTDKSQLYDGCAVLKTMLPGQSGYALPDRYLSDADLIDYNHIGIGTDGGEILDSTRTASGRDGPGVSTAKIGRDSWDIIADFEDVDYSATNLPQEGEDGRQWKLG